MSTFSYVGKHEFAKPSALVSKSIIGAAMEGNIDELQKCLSAGERMDQWDEVRLTFHLTSARIWIL
jgi:hypothetical protein